MRPLLPATIAVTATVLLAACGGSSSSPSSSSGSSSSSSGLSVDKVDGVGNVLVDARGRVLYTPEQEADGRVRCAAGCTAIWAPAAPVSGGAPDGVGRIAAMRRPDGMRQLTVAGHPVYTFAQDAPGQASGDGVTDMFGGRRLTWHAVTIGARTAPAAPSRGAYGY